MVNLETAKERKPDDLRHYLLPYLPMIRHPFPRLGGEPVDTSLPIFSMFISVTGSAHLKHNDTRKVCNGLQPMGVGDILFQALSHLAFFATSNLHLSSLLPLLPSGDLGAGG